MNKFKLKFLSFMLIFTAIFAIGCSSKKQNKEKDTIKEKSPIEKEQKPKDKVPGGSGSLSNYNISSDTPERVSQPSKVQVTS